MKSLLENTSFQNTLAERAKTDNELAQRVDYLVRQIALRTLGSVHCSPYVKEFAKLIDSYLETYNESVATYQPEGKLQPI